MPVKTYNSSNDYSLECFKMEATNILTDLNDCHKIKNRQIDRVFNTLFDNIPNEMKNLPINDVLEKLFTAARKKVENITKDLTDDTEIVDESIIDFNDDMDGYALFY